MESNRVNITIRSKDGEDGSEGIVRGISFYDHLHIRYPVSKNRSMGKFFLKFFKSSMTFLVKVPRRAFLGEPRERNDDIGVSEDETMIKVTEA